MRTYSKKEQTEVINTMKTELLSRTECNALRGIAIAGIFLHNYCHWLGPVVKENEYQYFRHNVDWLIEVMGRPFDSLTLFHIISFFGHYGVPVFLFLSAYGLYMKYEQPSNELNNPKTKDPSAWSFIRYHWLKLFRMMIVGFVAFTMVDAITPGRHSYEPLDIIAQLGLFNNILPQPDKIIWPGPYWFFGLMIQLYIVYRVLLYKRHWGWTVGLILLCAAIQVECGPESEELNRWRYNFVGGILPFGLGLLYGRFMPSTSKSYQLGFFILSLIAIWVFNLSYITWYLIPVVICTASISFIKLLQPLTDSNNPMALLRRWIMQKLDWLGSISAALFVCHAITRKIFIPISREGNYWAGLLLYIVSSVCLAWLFKLIMAKIPNPKLK